METCGSTEISACTSTNAAEVHAVSASISTPVLVQDAGRCDHREPTRSRRDAHLNAVQPDRMAKRDEHRCSLGSHNPGKPGGGQKIGTFEGTGKQVGHIGHGGHCASGFCDPQGGGLASDVDHMGLAVFVDMGQSTR